MSIGRSASNRDANLNPKTVLISLVAAHRSLVDVLTAAIDEYRRISKYPKWHEARDLIQDFVGVLYKLDGGRDELQHLASFVETRTGPGTVYEFARDSALSSFTVQPTKLSRSHKAFWEFVRPVDPPQRIEEVKQITKKITNILDENLLGLDAAGQQAFDEWRRECRQITVDAEALPIDGARYLLKLRAPVEGGESDCTELALALGTCLENVNGAVDWLLQWARDSVRTSSSAPPKQCSTEGGNLPEFEQLTKVVVQSINVGPIAMTIVADQESTLSALPPTKAGESNEHETLQAESEDRQVATVDPKKPDEEEDPDASIPAATRHLSPSRLKARAAYDWAKNNLDGFNDMTIDELFVELRKRPDMADMIGPNAGSFSKYLRDAGVKRNGRREAIPRSVVRENEI